MPPYCKYGLLAVILLQWALFSVILVQREQEHRPVPPSTTAESDPVIVLEQDNNKKLSLAQLPPADQGGEPKEIDLVPSVKLAQSNPSAQKVEWEGVALGLMLKRPRWWFKRYHFMIQNALVNIPPNWALQLMVNQEWYERELLPYHRNLQRWINLQGSRVIVTQLPKSISKLKPGGVLRDRWVWEHVVADHVLVFHGEGMLCSNSNKSWADLMHIDYVGTPWGKFGGRGGDGTAHSFRNRRAMLAAMDYHGGAFPSTAKEDVFFVSTLLKMNAAAAAGGDKTKHTVNRTILYHVATPDESNWFGGTSNLQLPNGSLDRTIVDTWGPMLVSGTQSHLKDEARSHIIGVCPEIKIIFPSLHNPNCFGAKPNEAFCAASLGFKPPCSSSSSSSSSDSSSSSSASTTTSTAKRSRR